MNKVCIKCKKLKKHEARGMCRKCYDEWYKQQPETQKKLKAYRKKNSAKAIEASRKWRKNNPERHKKHARIYARKYRKKHGKRINQLVYKSEIKRSKKDACKLIQAHEKAMKDDPEALSLDFMEEMTGIDCKPLREGEERDFDLDEVLERVRKRKPLLVPKCIECGKDLYKTRLKGIKYCTECRRLKHYNDSQKVRRKKNE